MPRIQHNLVGNLYSLAPNIQLAKTRVRLPVSPHDSNGDSCCALASLLPSTPQDHRFKRRFVPIVPITSVRQATLPVALYIGNADDIIVPFSFNVFVKLPTSRFQTWSTVRHRNQIRMIKLAAGAPACPEVMRVVWTTTEGSSVRGGGEQGGKWEYSD